MNIPFIIATIAIVVWIACIIFNTIIHRKYWKQAIGTRHEEAFTFAAWFITCVVLAIPNAVHNIWMEYIQPDDKE